MTAPYLQAVSEKRPKFAVFALSLFQETLLKTLSSKTDGATCCGHVKKIGSEMAEKVRWEKSNYSM